MAQRGMSVNSERKIIGSFQYYENRVIGQGSYSVVFQGRKVATNQYVCIKRIEMKSPLIQRLAKTQIEVLRRVTNKNILKFIAYIEKRPYIYIVTQLCEMNLLQEIRKEERFSEQKSLETFLQILQGYQQLRNNGYIHRDIKPQNLLVSEGSIRLADFGYAITLSDQSIRQNFNVGTPLYMAPQSLNYNIYSQKSDIWSLGVTLYEIMAGKVPFTSKDELNLKRQLKNPIKDLDCSLKTMKIIRKCLQYESTERYGLQKLILEVKLLLSQFFISQKMPLKIKSKVQVNELNYISFMEYVILLAQRCPNLNQNVKQRCIFLMEYNIRMRLDLIEKLFVLEEQNGQNSKLGEQYQRLKYFHSFQLRLSSRIVQNDRLNFFKVSNTTFQQSLQWQTQAQLKHLVKQMNYQIQRLKTQHNILLDECKVKLLDFLLTAFVLNKMCIEQENSLEQFTNSSKLQLIMKSPSRITLKTLQNIKAKAAQLKII